MERDPLDVEPLEELGREVEPGRRRRGRAGLVGVDGLVPLGIPERLGDVGRQGRLAGRLALQPDEPAPTSQRLDELERPQPRPRKQPPARARERLPEAVADRLEQEHLRLAARRAPQPQPGRHDARVVDDHERAPRELVRQVAEPAVAHLPAARPLGHEQT